MQRDSESDICDLDPNNICDNCCKCIEQPDNLDENGYRVIVAEFRTDEDEPDESLSEQASALAAFFAEEEGEEEELPEIDPLDIPPELLAEWEAKLAASFREEEENLPAQPKLHGSRKKRG